MKRMLINASQPEELRVALIDGQSIYDFDLEQQGQERKRSNIYKAKISRIEPSLDAAFVDFGSEKHGFLPMKELSPRYLKQKKSKNTIDDCLNQGQELIVQVDKEERGTKGAALTTYISIPGHYLVLMPNNPEANGISRTLEGEDRNKVKENLKNLEAPSSMGLIARTAAKGGSLDELKWDLEYLLSVWDAIQEANQLREAPFLIYRDDDLISRSLRDFLREDITEVLVDSEEAYEKASEFASRLAPELQSRIKRYDEVIPLFTRYQVESQIETAYQRKVQLNSGGSIVIDQTEALVSIDINSSKATSGSNIEETAFKTNIEAAKEIAKQLRLRDIGGLIVIDFIDMGSLKNKRAVEDMVHESISIDRAKIQVGRISRFGLLEMSRQRLRPSLQERWTQDIGSLSTAVLRLIEEEAGKKKSGEVRAIVSSDMSAFLLNERRSRINEIEEKSNVRVVVVSDPGRLENRFEVSRLKSKDKKLDEASYNIKDELGSPKTYESNYKTKTIEKAAVEVSPRGKPKRKKPGFLSKIIETITGEPNSKSNKEKSSAKKNNHIKKKPQNKKKNQNFSQKKKTSSRKGKEYINKDKKTLPKKQKADGDRIVASKKGSHPKKKKIEEKKINNNSKLKTDKSNKSDNLPDKEKGFKKNDPSKIKKSVSTDNKISVKDNGSKVETKEEIKSAKDWGMASNDPRNQSK